MGRYPGLDAAERVFEVSSDLALRLLETLDGKVAHRLGLGCLIVSDLVDALGLTDEERSRFLETHYRWWSGAGAGTAGDHDLDLRSTHDRVLPEVLSRIDELRRDATASGLVGEFTGALLEQIRQGNPQRKPLFLAFHQLHLMLNRLGVVRAEEAIVSLVTRTHLENRPPGAYNEGREPGPQRSHTAMSQSVHGSPQMLETR